MNVRGEVRSDLWEAISKHYESQIYSSAILEAIHLLSDTLRERANVDGDGMSLVGQALGGESPRLKINKFQTETERNEQKGLEQILRGIYQGVRNPRSHEQCEDSKETADAIIIFINYILEIVSKAKQPFTFEEWSKRVFDPDFVFSDRYAELLAAEVPSKKYNETLISLYRSKSSENGNNLHYIFRELIRLAGDDKLDDFLAVVSDELRITQDDAEVKLTLQILPAQLWHRISEVARLRIENKLIRSVASGEYYAGKCVSGWLGTWGRDFFKNFSLKNELYETMLKKLQGSGQEKDYVAEFFLFYLSDTIGLDTEGFHVKFRRERYVRAIVQAVSYPSAPVRLREKFLQRYNFPEEWQGLILQEIKSVKERDPEYFEKVIDYYENVPF